MDIEPAFPRLSLPRIVHLAAPPDGSSRLFAVLQPGQVVVFPNDPNVESASLFLDIRDKVDDTGREEGLLGLAFDPSFRDNGYFYVNYTATNPDRSVISRFSVSSEDPSLADPDSERVILEVGQPYANHNGGHLVFGPDGYLYIGLGDGGSGGDPHRNGQNTGVLLGKILRIDVSTLDAMGRYTIPPDNPFVGRGPGFREEVWAYGLRNPWRFNFDPQTGLLWAADVGQNRLEEVDIIVPGGNYGWNIMEGTDCFSPRSGCNTQGLVLPVAEYDHGDGCSITGGYVYRGSRLPQVYGAYIYADYCSGKIWALRYDGARITEQMELLDSQLPISAFGLDQSGELYILSHDGGIYRLKAR